MDDLSKISILIPAYKPPKELINLIKELKSYNFYSVIVVNDGSGPDYDGIFETARKEGAVVLSHDVNKGKGRAIKTGYNHFLIENKAEGIVTADSDGQHLPKDIKRVALAVSENNNSIVLGSRHFTNEVPLRSRMGNAITRRIFSIATAIKVHDTQTGLRGASREVVNNIIKLGGERYEYEMNVLLEAKKMGFSIIEVPIDTVYFNNNKGSHFNTFSDAFRIYKQIVLFCGSAFFSFLIDFAIFSLLISILPGHYSVVANIFISTVVARLFSSVINFSINKSIFISSEDSKRSLVKYLARYYALVVVILFINGNFVSFLNVFAGLNVYFSKIIVEITLFVLNFFIQRSVVFRKKSR